MKKRKFLMFLALCAGLCLMANASNIQAQDSSTSQAATKQAETRDEDINLDTQLYLIVGTNQDVVESKLPAQLDGVVKQLRAALPFKNYRLAATLLNRVKNEGRLDVKWIGGPLAPTSTPSLTPSFSNFSIRQIRMHRSSDGQQIIQVQGFNFGARVPIQTGQAVASNTPAGSFPTGGFPTINYEPTGVATDISLREAEPVIVGTLTVGTTNEAIILVLSAKRTGK